MDRKIEIEKKGKDQTYQFLGPNLHTMAHFHNCSAQTRYIYAMRVPLT
jgi:hypothetical protein